MGQICAGLGAPRMKSKHLLLKEGGRSPQDPMECQWGQQNASFLWELVSEFSKDTTEFLLLHRANSLKRMNDKS